MKVNEHFRINQGNSWFVKLIEVFVGQWSSQIAEVSFKISNDNQQQQITQVYRKFLWTPNKHSSIRCYYDTLNILQSLSVTAWQSPSWMLIWLTDWFNCSTWCKIRFSNCPCTIVPPCTTKHLSAGKRFQQPGALSWKGKVFGWGCPVALVSWTILWNISTFRIPVPWSFNFYWLAIFSTCYLDNACLVTFSFRSSFWLRGLYLSHGRCSWWSRLIYNGLSHCREPLSMLYISSCWRGMRLATLLLS